LHYKSHSSGKHYQKVALPPALLVGHVARSYINSFQISPCTSKHKLAKDCFYYYYLYCSNIHMSSSSTRETILYTLH